MREPKSVPDLLTTRLLRLSNTLGLYASRRYRDEFGITAPEWRVLSILATRDGMTARDVSRILATDKGWVSLSVEKLCSRGFVSRSPDENDTRRRPLSLTGEGRVMHDAVMAVARQRHRRLLSALPEADVATLVANLERLQLEADLMLDELDVPNRADKASNGASNKRPEKALTTITG